MNFLTLQLCRRLRYRSYNGTIVNNIVKRCSHASQGKEESVPAPTKSKLFPDYDVIYHYPYISFSYLINRLKRNFTVVTGLCVPITLTASLLDVLPLIDSFTIILSSVIITGSLHGCGYLCNNAIGSICVKDKEKIVISYIDYWGTRKDIKTDIKDVEPLSDIVLNKYKPGQLFRYMEVKTPKIKKKLKLYISYGKIHDKSQFYNVVGEY